MRDVAKVVDDTRVLMHVETAAKVEVRELHPVLQLVAEARLQLPPRSLRFANALPGLERRLLEPEHIHGPRADRFHHYLRALAFEEGEHPEVAVAFRRLRPEF